MDRPLVAVPLLYRASPFHRRIMSGRSHGPSLPMPSTATSRCPAANFGDAAASTRP